MEGKNGKQKLSNCVFLFSFRDVSSFLNFNQNFFTSEQNSAKSIPRSFCIAGPMLVCRTDMTEKEPFQTRKKTLPNPSNMVQCRSQSLSGRITVLFSHRLKRQAIFKFQLNLFLVIRQYYYKFPRQ